MTDPFELPGQYAHRMNFISKYENINNESNLEALSRCYANYKVLGVLYPSELMKKIYDFDQQFGIKEKANEVEVNDLKVKETIPKSYYKPKKFTSAQEVAGFTFINFVKSSGIPDDTDVNVISNQEKTAEVNKEIKKTISSPQINTIYVSFEDALKHSSIEDSLKKLQSMYIQMKVVEDSQLSIDVLLHTISKKCDLSIDFKCHFDKKIYRCVCKIIINESVLIGEGIGTGNKNATEEALHNFHQRCIKDSNIVKEIEDIKICFPPEDTIDNDLDIVAEGVEIFELDILKDFYIKNNCNEMSSAILVEAFQFFKMFMQFKEFEDSVLLFVNDKLLACMPIDVSFSKTKTLLAHFVLKHLENTKWTMMRNEINQIDDSVEKEGMYDKNLKDPAKIDTAINVGGQLMLKMGWDEESGLGKSGTGIKDPIINDGNGRRQGLGFNFGSSKDTKSFANNVSECLRSWLRDDGDEITFDRKFDNKERAIIHKECRKLGIASKSYNNKEGDRFLVVSKTRSPQELFDWVKSNGGKTRLYTLFPPGFRKSSC